MLRLQNPQYLYALALIPLIILLFVASVYWRKKKLKGLGDETLIMGQLLGYIPGRTTYKFMLTLLALTALIIGITNLQAGDKPEKVEKKGVDVMIALDVSKSMLATDVQPDRLTRAKQMLMLMAEKFENDRVGLIAFAGKPYLEMPLTIDYRVLRMMLNSLSPDDVPTQGTVIADAVDKAIEAFPKGEGKYKALIIISDGEDHDPNASAKVKEAAAAGIVVHTVGIGSPEGSTIYDPQTHKVKIDDNGNPVISKLNENELRTLAAEGAGTYTLLTNANETATKLVNQLNSMEQKNLGSVVFTDYESYFQYFLLAAFLLLLWEGVLKGAKYAKVAVKQ